MLRNPLYRYGDENEKVFAHMNHAKAIYDNMCKNREDIAVMSDTGEKLTYGEFAQLMADIALSLARIGVKKGDVIGICSGKSLEFLPTVLGITSAGGTYAPLDPTYGNHPQLHRLKMIQPKIVFSTLSSYDKYKETFEAVGSIKHYILYGEEERQGTILFKDFLTVTAKLEEFQPVEVEGWKDRFCIYFSSGTTGLPKGVPKTHLSTLLTSQVVAPDSYKGLKIMNFREWLHGYGLSFSLGCLRVGATIVYSLKIKEIDMLEAIHKFRTEVVQAAPSLLTELVKSTILDQYDLSCVKYILSGSTCLRKEAIEAIKQRIPSVESISQMYGLTELGWISYEFSSRPGSIGMPCPGVIVKVVDLETRQPLGANQPGEICAKGPGLIKQYVGIEVHDFKDEEGFMKTGDVGYYDEDGYFYIVNRIKDLIKFCDRTITPAEIEEILLQHSSVREAGVVGAPHPTYGEVPVAFVVLHSECKATEEELVQHVNSKVSYELRLAGGVRFIDKLPRGEADKLNRKALVSLLRESTAVTNGILH